MKEYQIKVERTFYNGLATQQVFLFNINYNFIPKLLPNLYQAFNSLKYFPNGYQRIKNTPYRRLVLNKRYIIIYFVDDIHKIVYIQYLFSTKQDYLKLIS